MFESSKSHPLSLEVDSFEGTSFSRESAGLAVSLGSDGKDISDGSYGSQRRQVSRVSFASSMSVDALPPVFGVVSVSEVSRPERSCEGLRCFEARIFHESITLRVFWVAACADDRIRPGTLVSPVWQTRQLSTLGISVIEGLSLASAGSARDEAADGVEAMDAAEVPWCDSSEPEPDASESVRVLDVREVL